jgi:DNA-binding transcriptional LysR family regulator
MAELVDLVVLARVVERGSFARAAADLGLPPSTLSRRVAALERRLGMRVLERTTRHLRPTEIGELLAERGQRVRRELEDAERAVADHQRAPRGLLRLSVPTPVADDFIGPALAEYLRRYPDMRLEVVAEDRLVDLVTEGFDAALRIGRLTDSALGAVRLAVLSPVLAAAPRYLERAPPLRRPRDLAAHAFVAFGKRRRQAWTFVGRGGATEDVELVPRANATSAPLVAQLAAEGAGVALLPRSVVARAGLAVLEPGGFRPRPSDLSIVTPSARISATKVRAFVDLMREFVASRPDLFDAVVPDPGSAPSASARPGRARA